MKGTEQFKRTIGEYLQVRANTDEQFAKSFAKEGKTLDGCVTFILNTVKESGCNGFDDEEIYGMAVHYYDEDEVDPKYMKNVGGNVVVNHQIKLTDAEKARKREEMNLTYPVKRKKFFGLIIDGKGIEIRVLQSVDEFAEEGAEMCHCVYANEYYNLEKHPTSLIMSARRNGQRLRVHEYDGVFNPYADIEKVRGKVCAIQYVTGGKRYFAVKEIVGIDEITGTLRMVYYYPQITPVSLKIEAIEKVYFVDGVE